MPFRLAWIRSLVRPMSALLSCLLFLVGTASTQLPPRPPAPELPRTYVSTAYHRPSGTVITVRAGGNLQAALDRAQPGDVILVEAGATFTGNFELRPKTGH